MFHVLRASILPINRRQIVDSSRGASVQVHKAGFPDAVVWNPWVDKSRAMGDFGDEEYKVCCCGVCCGVFLYWIVPLVTCCVLCRTSSHSTHVCTLALVNRRCSALSLQSLALAPSSWPRVRAGAAARRWSAAARRARVVGGNVRMACNMLYVCEAVVRSRLQVLKRQLPNSSQSCYSLLLGGGMQAQMGESGTLHQPTLSRSAALHALSARWLGDTQPRSTHA